MQGVTNGGLNNTQNSDGLVAWNLDVVIAALKSAVPDVTPQAVASAFDHPGFFISSAKAFTVLMEAWKKLTSEPYPLHVSPCKPPSQVQVQQRFGCTPHISNVSQMK